MTYNVFGGMLNLALSRGAVRGGYLDRHTRLQVSMCSGYNLGHHG